MKPLTRKDFTTNVNQLEDLIITEEQLKQILEYQEFHESFYPYSKRLEQENKMYLSKIDELTKETKQRGLIIGKKDEKIKQLKEGIERIKEFVTEELDDKDNDLEYHDTKNLMLNLKEKIGELDV